MKKRKKRELFVTIDLISKTLNYLLLEASTYYPKDIPHVNDIRLKLIKLRQDIHYIVKDIPKKDE